MTSVWGMYSTPPTSPPSPLTLSRLTSSHLTFSLASHHFPPHLLLCLSPLPTSPPPSPLTLPRFTSSLTSHPLPPHLLPHLSPSPASPPPSPLTLSHLTSSLLSHPLPPHLLPPLSPSPTLPSPLTTSCSLSPLSLTSLSCRCTGDFPRLTADEFQLHLNETLIEINRTLPRTFVNLVLMGNISEVQ